ncbi:hypothetical protein GCM10027594_11430 [Hymenobacter agri]
MLVAVCCQTSRAPAPSAPATAVLPEHLTLGNPSGATAYASQHKNYMLLKPQFALS